jgi:hypothetical protein
MMFLSRVLGVGKVDCIVFIVQFIYENDITYAAEDRAGLKKYQ